MIPIKILTAGLKKVTKLVMNDNNISREDIICHLKQWKKFF